jgi:hypothetical protein
LRIDGSATHRNAVHRRHELIDVGTQRKDEKPRHPSNAVAEWTMAGGREALLL